jgi:hypothetical protein
MDGSGTERRPFWQRGLDRESVASVSVPGQER